MFPATKQTVMADEESSEAILNATTQPDVRTIFVELLGEVKKMNENFTNIPYVDEDEPLAAIAQDLDVREKTGFAISDGLAGILTSMLKDKLADEKIQSKIDKYPRPSNVEGLRTPRVNHLI